MYESFKIPKKNGGFRQIHAPKKDLKQIQKSLAEALYKCEKEIAKRMDLILIFLTHSKRERVLLRMLKYIEISVLL